VTLKGRPRALAASPDRRCPGRHAAAAERHGPQVCLRIDHVGDCIDSGDECLGIVADRDVSERLLHLLPADQEEKVGGDAVGPGTKWDPSRREPKSRGRPYFPMMKTGNHPEGFGQADQPPGAVGAR
jgi:hypothetical protein